MGKLDEGVGGWFTLREAPYSSPHPAGPLASRDESELGRWEGRTNSLSHEQKSIHCLQGLDQLHSTWGSGNGNAFLQQKSLFVLLPKSPTSSKGTHVITWPDQKVRKSLSSFLLQAKLQMMKVRSQISSSCTSWKHHCYKQRVLSRFRTRAKSYCPAHEWQWLPDSIGDERLSPLSDSHTPLQPKLNSRCL